MNHLLRATSAPPDVAARIFTVEEELPFAGHPVIGAAAALHERIAPEAASVQWQFTHGRQVPVVRALCQPGSAVRHQLSGLVMVIGRREHPLP